MISASMLKVLQFFVTHLIYCYFILLRYDPFRNFLKREQMFPFFSSGKGPKYF